MAEDDFVFYDACDLFGKEIRLVIENKTPADLSKGFVPAYGFAICDLETGTKMGEISLRVGYNENIFYGGNIGYNVSPEYRGRHYAAKACRLVFKLARKHGMKKMIITCNPDNFPSRRTCELVGAKLMEIADLPPENDMYLEGERQKCIYEVTL